jgi:Phi-29-like late genes activator (early protein GP4).
MIAYDLKESPYHVTVDGITYYFSSTFLLGKFMERLEMTREVVNASLSHRFKMEIDFRQVADLTLYSKTESRGFRIVFDDGRELHCLSQVRFAGGNVTPNN